MEPLPPDITGLTWRSVTPDDLNALVALAEDIRRTDGGLAFLNTPQSLYHRAFGDAPGPGLGAFDEDGRLAAAVSLQLMSGAAEERVVIVGGVRPDLRSQGLGTYLLQWSAARSRDMFTAGGAKKRLLRIASEAFTEPARRLFTTLGFENTLEALVMDRDLTRPLPDHPFPEDVTISTWEPDVEQKFFKAYHNAFRARPGFPNYTAEEWIGGNLENEELQPHWSLLACVGEEPVGFVFGSKEVPYAYIVQVGVVPSQRRRGLASALMTESMRRMQADGQVLVQLEVHVNNPGAIQSYERLGFVTTGRRAKFERPAD